MGIFRKKKKNVPDFWEDYASLFAKKQPDSLEAIRFVVLDTETTGFDYATDRILSIGALALQNNKITVSEVLELYLDQYYYHAENVMIHGILKEDDLPRISELEALQKLLTFLGASVIVAHHAGFDIRMINEALKRHGLPKLKNRVLDTGVLYKRTLIRSPLLERKEQYTLDELADKFDLSKKDRHTALGDAYITALAFIKITARLAKKRKISLKWLLG